MLPHGYEIYYEMINSGRIDFPDDWIEISKEAFQEVFNNQIKLLKERINL